MKRFVASLVVLGLFSAIAGAEPTDQAQGSAAGSEIRVMTFNVLVEVSVDARVPRWKERKEECAALVRKFNPDLLGLQEPTAGQVKFFSDSLPAYTAIVAEKFTDATLMFRTALFEELERGHWWLSPTPEKLSTGFGNFLPRIVVWAKLKHRPTGVILYAVNTHFDNTRPSQLKMAELSSKKLKPMTDSGHPVLFFGDFNTDQERGNYSLLTSDGWKDSYLASPKASPTGRDENVPTMVDGGKRIDHIFYFGPQLKAIAWERLDPATPGRFYSDHYAVGAVFRLTK